MAGSGEKDEIPNCFGFPTFSFRFKSQPRGQAYTLDKLSGFPFIDIVCDSLPISL